MRTLSLLIVRRTAFQGRTTLQSLQKVGGRRTRWIPIKKVRYGGQQAQVDMKSLVPMDFFISLVIADLLTIS